MKLCESSYKLTYGGPLLTVSSRAVSVEDPDSFVKATVELCSIRREAEGVGRCQLIQVIVGPETGSHFPVKCVPHVDWVVAATAG